jgi:hypothetical protein
MRPDRNAQEPFPRVLTPSEDESRYLEVLGQIELRRLELKRIDVRHGLVAGEIKSLERMADELREKAVAK